MKHFLKRFFGPSWIIGILKIILGLAVYYLMLYIEARVSIDYQTLGLPIRILTPCGSNTMDLSNSYNSIVSTCGHQSYVALIVDGIFWYAITSLVINLFIKNKLHN